MSDKTDKQDKNVAAIPSTPNPVQGQRTIVPVRIKSGDLLSSWRTFTSYGRTRCGKTRFAATWPRPLFIADASERGWVTIESMPSDDYYEADRPPLVWPVSDALQMAEALRDARPLVDRGEVFSVITDSLTFYLESFFTWLKGRTAAANPGQTIDTRALYGALAEHAKVTRQNLHKWPCNVGWLALAQPPDSDSPIGGPAIIGKAREQHPAACDFIFYHRSYPAADPETGEVNTYYEMHTQSFDRYLAGGRDSGMLPASMFNPTYRDIAQLCGIPDPVETFAAQQEAAKSPAKRAVT